MPNSQLYTIPGYEDPDSGLDAKQRADAGVWDAYVEETVVDLVVSCLTFPSVFP